MTKKRLSGICIVWFIAAAISFGDPSTAATTGDGLIVRRSGINIFPTLHSNTAADTPAADPSFHRFSSNRNIGPAVLQKIVTQGESGTVQDAILGGASLTMLDSDSKEQMLSCIIQTTGGKLIVVDGGLGTDAPKLLNQLRERGGHVGAWLVTHPHGDHVGALFEILEYQDRNLTIDGIYYSLVEPEWYSVKDPMDAEMAHAIINTLGQLSEEIPHGNVSRSQEIWVDDVKIEVLNDRYDMDRDSGNNAGIVYRVTVNGTTILFLGDLGEEGGERLLAENGEGLKADIVQMAHHGQNGVGQNVYQAINPSICLWPTPQWLWDNDKGSGANSGSWKTASTKGWLNQISEAILHYVTKDGDLTIY